MLLPLQVVFFLHHTQILTRGIQNVEVNVMVVVRFCLQAHRTKNHAQLFPHHRHPFRHSHHLRIHDPAHLCRERITCVRVEIQPLHILCRSPTLHLQMMLVDEFQGLLHLHNSQTVLVMLQVIVRERHQHRCLHIIVAIHLCQSQRTVSQPVFQRHKPELANQFLDEHPP